ncbi:MAG: hypothetical protein ABGW95_04015, partial [Candidatus Poseidoniia archaeon]
ARSVFAADVDGDGDMDVLSASGLDHRIAWHENRAESESCDVDCTFAACGDGVSNATADEQCDDGNLAEGDCCSSLCQLDADGAVCEDGAFCTAGETCTAGVCGGGGPRVCSHLNDECNTGFCDESEDICDSAPDNDDVSCEDGVFCTTGETCTDGVCGGGVPTDCSGAGDQCNTGICDEDANACLPLATNENDSCSDGNSCTREDTCSAGVCGGDAVCSGDGVCEPRAWEPMGEGLGMQGELHGGGPSLAVDPNSGALFAAGIFTTAGGAPANFVAVWDPATETWSPLGEGLSSAAFTAAVDPNSGVVFAAGSFTEAGGAPASRVAMWDPATETWLPLGEGVNNQVASVAVDPNSG